jgi:hypothetical protein
LRLDGDGQPELLCTLAWRDRLHRLVEERLKTRRSTLHPKRLNRIRSRMGDVLVAGLPANGRIRFEVANVVGDLESLAKTLAETPPRIRFPA